MAKKRKRKKAAKHKKKSHKKGHIPLEILEKRARKLIRVVNSRGGVV